MRGTDRSTGKRAEGLDHLRQSITDILTTPLGTRVMRPGYGSRLPRLVDAPANAETLVEIYAATAEALAKWEPRLSLTSVSYEEWGKGKITLVLEGTYLPDGQAVTLDGIEVTG